MDGCVKASSCLLLLCFDMTNSETNFAVDSFALHIHGFDCTYCFFLKTTLGVPKKTSHVGMIALKVPLFL